ncbi:penicillin-binding protein activator [Hyphococcus flavus]|uniref:Penicillin-binding protein activator n=1 Tax=Hyphococcus flavus TaxID=1866326 RepID=A0AAF0CC87_9PROT|nr:penicillin-binding protein activator [Hyphococcus flavus]WDI32875.1 penicillin-binding protein activator [Hyphococcus flavus]
MRSNISVKLALAAILTVSIAACGSSTPTRPSGPVISQQDYPDRDRDEDQYELPESPYREAERYDRRNFVEPPHMDDEPVRVGLLLPFSADNEAARRVASAMFDAAQLAVFDAGDEKFLLIPKDTRGNAEGAASAARSALADGAEIILGPLFSESVEAAAQVTRAASTPMIAFSSDLTAAGNGVFLLSFPPELEIARVTEFAMSQELTRFGVLAPRTEYGDRVSGAFAEEVFTRGGVIVHEERYEQDPDAMLEPAKRLAKYSQEIIPLQMRHEFEGDRSQPQPENASAEAGYTQGFQAVLMPEQGTLLRALAPLLPYYNVDINRVKILGVSAWNNPRLTREPALRGGWFAAPDPEITRSFENHYAGAFGSAPPRLASLAYDATLLSARLAATQRRRNRFDLDAIADPNGYFGADGLFRLNPDGTVDRGLAILEIQPGGIQTVDPAPRSFAPAY